MKPWSRPADSCWNLSRFLQHEAARSISTLPGRDASSPWQVTPLLFHTFPQQFPGTHLYTLVERSTVRVKCLAQEHTTRSPDRARTRTARSGDERTNHCLISNREGLGPSLKIMELATIDAHGQKEHTEIHKIPKFGVNYASFDRDTAI